MLGKVILPGILDNVTECAHIIPYLGGTKVSQQWCYPHEHPYPDSLTWPWVVWLNFKSEMLGQTLGPLVRPRTFVDRLAPKMYYQRTWTTQFFPSSKGTMRFRVLLDNEAEVPGCICFWRHSVNMMLTGLVLIRYSSHRAKCGIDSLQNYWSALKLENDQHSRPMVPFWISQIRDMAMLTTTTSGGGGSRALVPPHRCASHLTDVRLVCLVNYPLLQR